MADPFSAAGTAVGITSLGIQTFQILFRYYSQYRGFHDDIDDVLRRVAGLEGILRALTKILEKVRIDNHEPSSQLCSALKACEEVMERLKKAAERCGASKNVSSYKERLQLFAKRSQWPLKQRVLEEISSNLDKFQDNLSLALQALGLDINLQKFDHLESATKEIGDRTSRMESHILNQFDALQRIQGSLEQLVYYQQEQNSRVQEDFSNIHTTITAQGASTEQKLDLIIHTLTKFQTSNKIPPSFLAETIDTTSDIQPQLRKTLRRYKASARGIDSGDRRIAHDVSCQCRRRNRQSLKRKGWINLYSAETYNHETHCPQHRYADFSRTTAVKILVCNRILQFCMLVGWQQSRRSGWNSSIPVLQYRAVVPSDSLVFQKIRNSRLMKVKDDTISREELESGLATITNSLRKCFKDKASPTDIDNKGNGIAKALVDLVFDRFLHRGKDMDIFISFLDVWFKEGIPWNQTDEYGSTLIEHLQVLSFMNADVFKRAPGFDLLCYLIRRLGDWTVPTGFHKYAQPLYDNVSILLKSEEMYEALDAETPLLRSIFGRMESKFFAILRSESSEKLALMLTNRQYASPLASWPIGLKILLTSDLMNGYDEVITQLWIEALDLINPKSIELLICHGVRPTLRDWYSIHSPVLRYSVKMDRSHIYTKMFLRFAQNMRCGSLNDAPDMLRVVEPYEVIEKSSPYHVPYLTIEAAEGLWEAGHRCVNRVRWSCPDSRWVYLCLSGTPLWFFCSWCLVHREERRNLTEWFIEKGADQYQVHPKYFTTPATLRLRCALQTVWRQNDLSTFDGISKILEVPSRDECRCYCSRGGCYIIGIGSSKYARCHDDFENIFYARSRRRLLLPYLYKRVEKNLDYTWMSSAILRVQTFEELSLTHTCCYRIYDELQHRFTRPTAEEANVIHAIERVEINLLEELMVDFEQAWQRYSGTFVKFMRMVWKPRMREEIQKTKPLDTEEIFRQAGVRFEKPTWTSAQDSNEETEDDISEAGSACEDHGNDADNDADNDDEQGGYVTAEEE